MSRASPQVKSEASAGALKLVYPPAWYPWGLPAPLLLRLSPCIPARQIKYLRKKRGGEKKNRNCIKLKASAPGGWNVTGLFLIRSPAFFSFFFFRMFTLRKIKLPICSLRATCFGWLMSKMEMEWLMLLQANATTSGAYLQENQSW